MIHVEGAKRIEETPGWVVRLAEAACVDGRPCELYLTPDGNLTTDIEQAEFFPMLENGHMVIDVERQSSSCFFMPRPSFHPEQRFICLKVLRVLTTMQKTELL